MVKNREELLQRMIDLSGVGAEAIDTDSRSIHRQKETFIKKGGDRMR